MDEDISRPRYVDKKGGGLHPVVDRKWLNMLWSIYIYIYIYREREREREKRKKARDIK